MLTISKGMKEKQARSYLSRMLGDSSQYTLRVFGGGMPDTLTDPQQTIVGDTITSYKKLDDNTFNFGTGDFDISFMYEDYGTTSTWGSILNSSDSWAGGGEPHFEIFINQHGHSYASNKMGFKSDSSIGGGEYFCVFETPSGIHTYNFKRINGRFSVDVDGVEVSNFSSWNGVVNFNQNGGVSIFNGLNGKLKNLVVNGNTILPVHVNTTDDGFNFLPNYSSENHPLLFEGTYDVNLLSTNINENSTFRVDENYRDIGMVLRTDRFYIDYSGVASWFELEINGSFLYGKCTRILKGGHMEFEDSLQQDGNSNRVQLIMPF